MGIKNPVKGGSGDSSPAPKRGGGKMNISNRDARRIQGKNKGKLSMERPKPPTIPTNGAGL